MSRGGRRFKGGGNFHVFEKKPGYLYICPSVSRIAVGIGMAKWNKMGGYLPT